jgi:hypothetical protein
VQARETEHRSRVDVAAILNKKTEDLLGAVTGRAVQCCDGCRNIRENVSMNTTALHEKETWIRYNCCSMRAPT